MQANSSPVQSSQSGPHQGLEQRVKRAMNSFWRRPYAQHDIEAFAMAQTWLQQHESSPLIIDSGCGVGLSTRHLAKRFPDAAVIGIDRSSDRIGRDHGELTDNALLVRADLVDFWRLAHDAGWKAHRHYLLYPNPYPKPGLLKHRWQGHPVFPALLALGGKLELRSNWRIYVEEFTLAVNIVTGLMPTVEEFSPSAPYLTPFEQKYHASGHMLWRMHVDLDVQGHHE